MSGFQIASWIGLRLLAAIFLAYMVLPLAAVIPISFSSGTFLRYPLPGFSLRWYDTILAPYPWRFAFFNSLWIALATTGLATVLGTLCAYGFTSSEFRFKALLMALITSPLVVPVVITALAAYFFMAEAGLLGSFTAIILAHTVVSVPFVFITVTASLQGFDRALVRAAMSLGATPLQAFWSTALPLNLPGIFAGAVFAFVTSFDDVVIALFLASPAQQTLPRQLFSDLREHMDPSLVAVATLLTGISLVFYAVVHVLRSWGLRRRGEAGPA